MSLIDETYFDGDLVLDVTQNGDAVLAAIAEFEPVYLELAFGAALYNSFIEGLDNPTDGDFDIADFNEDDFYTGEIEDRWKWLRDGKTFVGIDGRTYNWPGLTATKGRSPLAIYVYYRYARLLHRKMVAMGIALSKSENSTIVPADYETYAAWNRMVKTHDVLVAMLESLKDGSDLLYPEWVRPVYDRYNDDGRWELFRNHPHPSFGI